MVVWTEGMSEKMVFTVELTRGHIAWDRGDKESARTHFEKVIALSKEYRDGKDLALLRSILPMEIED